MRNLIKYPPLEWRKRHQYSVPQGPSFATAPWVNILIAGSSLRFKAPRHSPRRFGIAQVRLLTGVDLLQDSSLCDFAQGMMANNHWGYATALRRKWAFWGPWMTGCKAELDMSVMLVGRQPGFTFSDISFFHPRAYEMVLMTYLNDRYGHKNWEGNLSHVPRWHGPVDWQRHNHLPVFAGSCKIYSRGEDVTQMSDPEHLFFFPITDEHFVVVRFVQHLYSRDKNHKIAFDTSPIQALQDDIFNSISLELNPEAQASYNKVKKEVRNMQLPKEFPPLQWPTPPPEPDAESAETGPEVLQRDGVFIGR